MALVHEMLYVSSSFSALDFAAYVQSLTDSLLRAYGTDPAVIRLQLDMATVHLDINQAIPCALILNELVSNSLKYAFPDGRHGEIRLRLYCDPDGTTHMVVGDNGVGLPARVNPDKTESLGLQLVNTLVRQLRGTLEVHRGRARYRHHRRRPDARGVRSPGRDRHRRQEPGLVEPVQHGGQW